MKVLTMRSLVLATAVFFSVQSASAETIIKLTFGSTGPDVQLSNGVLTTVDDGVSTGSPGDQETTVDFDGFVETDGGMIDILLPEQGSFSLIGVDLVGDPIVAGAGNFSLVTQPTTGGTFELYDQHGSILLTGTLTDGSLHGTTGAAATSGFLTANLGSFTGPGSDGLNRLFKLLDPDSAAVSISLTDVISTPGGSAGLMVDANGKLMDFSADATGNISAEAINNQLPEPAGVTMAVFALLGLSGMRRRR